VVAVDWNNNHSGYSLALRLKKPAMVAPIAPLAEKVYVDTAGVQIDWIPSPSEEVVRYIIYRKEEKIHGFPGRFISKTLQRHISISPMQPSNHLCLILTRPKP
jgi:hypothetical protein